MQETKSLFVMVSQTDTYVGKLIRTIFRYPYNHVSMTLDPGLREWYSFARYTHDAPLYGGFVREPAERFLAKNGEAKVLIFLLEIPECRAAELEQYFTQAGNPDSKLLYNYYDALACSIGLHMALPNAHTCLSFANSVLGEQFPSIEALSSGLQPYRIFEGSLSELVCDSGCRDDRYFSRIGLIRGSVNSLMQLGILSCRLVRHGFDGYIAHRFHRTVH